MPMTLAALALALLVTTLLVAIRRGVFPVEAATKTAASGLLVALALNRWAPNDPFTTWILVGLALCAVGDVLLLGERTFPAGLVAFLAGHLGYLAGFATRTPVGEWSLLPLGPLLAVAVGAGRWLWPHLARIPHRKSAAAPDTPQSAALSCTRSVQRTYSTPPSLARRNLHISRRLGRLATTPGEVSGPDRLRLPVMLYVAVITAMTWGAAAAVMAGAVRWTAAPGAILFLLSDLAVARNRFVQPAFANRAWGLSAYYLGQLLLVMAM